MLSSELEIILNEAFHAAREARHELITVEHLLLALLDAPVVRKALQACAADVDRLQSELAKFIDETTPRLNEDDDREVAPTFGFQRVLQRAVFHVQSSGKKEVTAANVLVAVFSEKHSHAASLLSQQDVARLDVVNYIAHGATRAFTDAEATHAMFCDQTPVPTEELRASLRAAFHYAAEQLHEHCTVEHLLSAIIGGGDAQEALRRYGVDVESLQGDLKDFLHYTMPRRTNNEGRVPWTDELKAIIERAASNARSRGGSEITGADVLVAVFSQEYSTAAYLLSRQKISHLEIAERLRNRDHAQ